MQNLPQIRQNLLQIRQNLHTHTTYCDGKLSAEEMALAAIEKGGGSLGFSEHSYVWFEKPKYSMALPDALRYADEVQALKTKYAGRLEIFLGLERDSFTRDEDVPPGLDFVIGSAHFVSHDGKNLQIDNTYDGLSEICEKHFGGDIYALTECYYQTMAQMAATTKPDIIGHFDLITKSNAAGGIAAGRLFDETHPRYVKAALSAMDAILAHCKLFEINSGAMYRKGNAVPYPSQFLLRELLRRGGEITLSSDSHDAGSLYYKFNEMRELARSCGFRRIKRLTKDGFVDEAL